jgi:aryl-alcohol dehydrogenase-like predicted oxidoreductase
VTLPGHATAAGCARFASSFPDLESAGHFRPALDRLVSSIGAGTYGGEPSDAVDTKYREALSAAILSGVNFIDTSISYRFQRSELAVGKALADVVSAGLVEREALIVASKGGYTNYRLALPANPRQYVLDTYIEPGVVDPLDLAGGIHCISPTFLRHQVALSLRNLGLHTLDLYLIQDPETQLAFVDRATFRKRIQLAFAHLEDEVSSGRLVGYGVSSWQGVRRAPMAADYLSLEILMELAEAVAGKSHHFVAIQFPLNVGLPDAFTFRNQKVGKSLWPSLQAAQELGLAVIASATTMQGRLLGRAPALLAQAFPDLSSDVLRALQFVRSMPAVTTALIGTTNAQHAMENLKLASVPCDPARAVKMARSLGR